MIKNSKNLLAWLGVIAMVVSFTGCGSDPSDLLGGSTNNNNNTGGGNPVNTIPQRSTACTGVTFPAGVSLLAGKIGGGGTLDGTALLARFSYPKGMASDSSGNLYVVDSYAHTVRKITPAGIVSTLAGLPTVSGSADGTGSAARFNAPKSIAVDRSSGIIYVADSGNYTIRRVTPAGVVTTIVGLAGTPSGTNGTGDVARLGIPHSITVDSAGILYVAESFRKVRKIVPGATAATTLVSDFAGTGGMGITDGPVASAVFQDIEGIAADQSGNIYVSEYANHLIRKISGGTVTTIAGTGSPGTTNGAGNITRFRNPLALATDSSGNVYVADSGNNIIRKIVPGSTAAATTVSTLAGSTGGLADGNGANAKFYNPTGIMVADDGNVFVGDTYNAVIRKIDSSANVTTAFGNSYQSGFLDGQGGAARFNQPGAMALDSACNLYLADIVNSAIRKITPAGVVTVFAGSPAGASGSTDGNTTAARFSFPRGIVVDRSDNLYVADSGNHTIRKITPAGDVTTFAGTVGSSGEVDGNGTSAKFNLPRGIVIDGSGNLYVSDTSGHTIRRITPSGDVTTIAGTSGVTGLNNGAGNVATFNQPNGLALDSSGNLYVADCFNNLIRKVVPGATAAMTTVSTFAGSGVMGYADGTGVAAQFNRPISIAINANGDLYVAEASAYLRKISALGVVTSPVGKPYSLGVQLTNPSVDVSLGILNGVAVSGGVVFITSEAAVLTIAP